MPPTTPPATVTRRRWPLFVLCLAILAGLATVVVVKSCPPTPAPAGRPVPDMPVVVSPAEAKLRSAADAPPPAPVAPVDVKADPE